MIPWTPPELARFPDHGEQTSEPENVGTRELWRALKRRRGTIALVFVATVMAAGVWLLTTRPVFTATATLRVEPDEPHVLSFDEMVKQTDALPDSFQTQLKLLESRSLANRVIQQLSLSTQPDFQDSPDALPWIGRVRKWVRERLAAWMPKSPAPAAGSLGDLTMESPLTRTFESRLSVEPVRGSRLVKVSFDSHDPALAARVANTISQTFIAQSYEFRADTGRYASKFLTTQMEEARGRLEAAEEKLNAFLKANGINFVSPATVMARGAAAGGTERQDLITQQLATLSDSLLKARTDRMAKESLVQQAQGGNIDALPPVLQSPLIVKLREDLATQQSEYQKLSQTFKPEYPRMRQLQQSIGELQGQIRAEVAREAKGLEADYQAALENEHQIEQAMNAQRSEALALGDKLVQYNILRRDVDAGRELYMNLLTRLKEIQISSHLLTSPISIADPAEVPFLPSHPRKTMVLLLASMVGMLGGVGVAFLRERMDRRITNINEVERVLGVPKLGLVPEIYCFGRRYARQHRLHSGRRPFALVTHLESSSPFAESFRDLRTNLLYATPDRPPRTFMVTSPEAGDGKTSLAMNLAVSLAQLGSGEVLLVDGDLRHPELHTILRLPRSPGLTALLSGENELSEVVVPTDIPNLSFLPAGRRASNPGDLLASRRLGQALEVLSGRFEHIVFDTPPLCGVSDALNLAPRLEGVVLVLRHGRASRDDAQEAVQRLGAVRAKLLGVIVNAVDGEAFGRRHGYYSVRGLRGRYA